MRFAGQARSTNYDFETDRRFGPNQGRTDFTGESVAMGGIVPSLYNQAAKTGWDAQGALENSIVTRANEKVAAQTASTSILNARETRDARIEAAETSADYAEKAADKQSSNAMAGSVIGAVASIGGALLSDETTKHNIRPLNYALEKLRNLRPVTFHYNEEYSSSPERLHHGFIAQEFKQEFPDATYFDESTGKLCIDTGDLIGVLVRSIQELEGRLSHMEATQYLAGVR